MATVLTEVQAMKIKGALVEFMKTLHSQKFTLPESEVLLLCMRGLLDKGYEHNLKELDFEKISNGILGG